MTCSRGRAWSICGPHFPPDLSGALPAVLLTGTNSHQSHCPGTGQKLGGLVRLSLLKPQFAIKQNIFSISYIENIKEESERQVKLGKPGKLRLEVAALYYTAPGHDNYNCPPRAV